MNLYFIVNTKTLSYIIDTIKKNDLVICVNDSQYLFLKENNINVLKTDFNPNKIYSPIQFIKAKKFDGMIAGTEVLDESVLREVPTLKVISRVGVGMDGIDFTYTKKKGILVFNTPGILSDAVAELTIGLMLACLRKIPHHDRLIRQGIWKKNMGVLLKGKQLGIIGIEEINH